MRFSRKMPFIIAIILTISSASALFANVVKIDPVAKKGESDTNSLKVSGVTVKESQVGALIQNTTKDPQEFLLKVIGIGEPSYDLYINSNYAGEKSLQELQDGISLSIPGEIVDPAIMRCLVSVKPRIEAERERLSKDKNPEPIRVNMTLNQASSWVSLGLKKEELYRSMHIILAPAGSVLSKMPAPARLEADELITSLSRACWLLQNARDRMYKVIKDEELRNRAVVALTPVDFAASYTKINGKLRVEAQVINNCDIPIKGEITYGLPKGWKTDAKSLKFENLKSGQVYKLSFNLIPPPNANEKPEKLPIAANVTIEQDVFLAKLKLKTEAILRSE